MRGTITQSGATLYRESGAKLYKESTVAYELKKALNAQGWHFVQYRGIKNEMTACKLALIDYKAKVILWHDSYQIELAHKAFNSCSVTFQRVNL